MWKKASHRNLLKGSEHRSGLVPNILVRLSCQCPWITDLRGILKLYKCLFCLFTCTDEWLCAGTPVVLLYLCTGDQRAQLTFLAVSSSSIAFSYWACSMKNPEQRASRAGSDFSSRSSAMSCRAPNCCVAKASSRALEKCPACKIRNEASKTRMSTKEPIHRMP